MGQKPSYLKSLKKESVVQSVINCLTDAIRSGDLKPGDRVLELGAGMGAITGALAGHAGKTDCVEVSMKRSTINAVRHREFSNITI